MPIVNAARPLDREVFGYAYLRSLGDPTVGYPSWNLDLLSTVALFAIGVSYNGVLVADNNWNVWSSSTLTSFVAAAHQHGVKVVPTLVPAWRDSVDFCDTLYNGPTTVAQIVDQVKLKGVDGVNIDYEGSNYTCHPTNPAYQSMTTQALLTQFASEMRAGLDGIGPGYYLSIATYSGSASGNDGFFNIPALNQYVDSFFVMAYDMDEANQGYPPIACGSFCMAPVSPLANYYWNDSTSMTQYIAAVGASKVILGQPYYGRVACVSSAAPHAWALSYPSGDPRRMGAATYIDAAAAISSPDIQPGTYAIHRDANDPYGYDRWDTWYDNALGCIREMYWSDTTTLGTRYNYVNQYNLRGVGIWTLSYGGGSSELWRTLQAYFVACTGATLTATPPSPQLSATAVQLTATSANCNNPLYEFWIQPPGGSWSIVRSYSPAATFDWSTVGKPAGTYRFTVYARSSATNGIVGKPPYSFDSAAGLDYSLTTQPCTGLSVATAPASTALVGNTVTVTGNTQGCPGPQFEYWILYPGHSMYTLVQGYTSSALSWNTTGLAPGTYRINVWVRDASSVGLSANAYGSWDAYDASTMFQLTAGCTGLGESYSPAGGAMVGTTVQVTGAATGCPDPNPMYEFWILSPGASQYTLAQQYSSNPTLTWSTNALAPGTYRINIWVRDANTPGAQGNAYGGWDAYNASLYYNVTVGCPSVSESVTASSATSVTVTASAPGCPSPQYEFWVLYPGATSYTLVQPYGTAATLVFSTATVPKGTYRINVWVRDGSSAGVYGNASGRWDAYNAGLYYTVS